MCLCAVAVHTFPPLLPASGASRREGGGGAAGWGRSGRARQLHTGGESFAEHRPVCLSIVLPSSFSLHVTESGCVAALAGAQTQQHIFLFIQTDSNHVSEAAKLSEE